MQTSNLHIKEIGKFYPIIFFLALSIILFFLLQMVVDSRGQIKVMEYKESVKKERGEIECREDETKICNDNGCEGTQYCIDNRWTGCDVERICIPEKKVMCSIDACRYGHRICNRCGTNWSECIED